MGGSNLLPDFIGEKKNNSQGQGEWILTYSDMMTLLLTFFVLLYSYSRVDVKKFQQIIASFRKALSIETVVSFDESKAPPGISEEEIFNRIRGLIEEKEGLKGEVSVSLEEHRGIVVRFGERILFDLGKSELKSEALPIIAKIGKVLREVPDAEIRVEGHTDDIPIDTILYPSNWELSAARAAAVVRYFIKSCDLRPEQFEVVGYGEFKPAYPNTSEYHKRLNRRVEIVIKKSGEKAS